MSSSETTSANRLDGGKSPSESSPPQFNWRNMRLVRAEGE